MAKARFNKWRPIRDKVSVVRGFVSINTTRQTAAVQPILLVLVDQNVSFISTNWIGAF